MSALVAKLKVLIDTCVLRITRQNINYGATQRGKHMRAGQITQRLMVRNNFRLKKLNIYPFNYVDKLYVDMFH